MSENNALRYADKHSSKIEIWEKQQEQQLLAV